MKKIFIYATIILIIDQVSKALISLIDNIVIIKNFFMIEKVNNYGAAFGFLQNQNRLLILISLIALFILIKYFKNFKPNKRNKIAFVFLIGGLMGNLSDRLFLGYVRDFLSFKILNISFSIFNLADAFITIGVILLIIAILKGEDNENRS